MCFYAKTVCAVKDVARETQNERRFLVERRSFGRVARRVNRRVCSNVADSRESSAI